MGGTLVEGWSAYVILFLVGGLAGTVNVIAGGGSFLTLPVMIFLGLPPSVANGTNRVGIVIQNVGAVWGFHRHRLVELRWLAVAAAPGLLGTALGTWAAVVIGEEAFRRALAVIMVLVTLWTLWNPLADRLAPDPSFRRPRGRALAGLLVGFFAVGVYAGFVQAGVGFLILAVATMAGLNLVFGNALKVLLLLVLTPLSLALFAVAGRVEWGVGLVLGAGNLLGGLLGVHLTVRKGHAWIRRVVTAVIVVFAIRLWIAP